MPAHSTLASPSEPGWGTVGVGPPLAGNLRRRRIVSSAPSVEAADGEHLLYRLNNLRTIVPVFAEELASARRQAASLREENRSLLERVRRLQREQAGLR